MQRNLLLLSNSTLHGSGYLEWALTFIQDFLQKKDVKSILFIPYALADHDHYLKTVQSTFAKIGVAVSSVHQFSDKRSGILSAEAIFIGGGNTFRLLKKLYDLNLIEIIKKQVLNEGIPYIGSSAGTNVATKSICTTNDMPIVYPPSFDAMNLVPFNINPHYIDATPESKHMGETREERIRQYHEEEKWPVLGMREGCLLCVNGDTAQLAGPKGALLFRRGEVPEEFADGADLSFLLSLS